MGARAAAEKSTAYGRRKGIYDAIAAAKKYGTPLPKVLETHVWDRPAAEQTEGNATAGEGNLNGLQLETRQPVGVQVVGRSVSHPVDGNGHGGARRRDKGFTSTASAENSESQRTAERLTKHFTDLGAEDTLRASHTSLDSHAQLTALAKLPLEARETH